MINIFKKKKLYLLAACGVIGALLLVLVFLKGRGDVARHPNAVAFCKTYHARGSDDLSDRVHYLRSLEQYAPNDIYPVIRKMRLTYEQAQKQPSSYVGLELGISSSIQDFNDYTSSHCEQ